MHASRWLVVVLLTVNLCACEEKVPAGRIRVMNTSDDQEYNVVEVSGRGTHYSLNPGEFGLMPKGTTDLTFSRRYATYTRTYHVHCPAALGDGITIKLIDVHMGRIAGGCETIDASKE